MSKVNTKKDIITRIAATTSLPANQVSTVVEAMITEITTCLSCDESVVFRNFGTFETMIHQPKVGRNPKQPEKPIKIPSRKVVKFKTGRRLKEAVTM